MDYLMEISKDLEVFLVFLKILIKVELFVDLICGKIVLEEKLLHVLKILIVCLK